MGANTSTEKVPTSSSARPAAPSFGARAPSPAANHANATPSAKPSRGATGTGMARDNQRGATEGREKRPIQRGPASEPPGEDGPGSLLFVVFLGFLLDFLVLVVVLF